jgi:putative phage-type endonuclease
MTLSVEQLAMRNGPNGFVGASEIAMAVNVSRWGGPIDLWLKKTGRAEEEGENPRANIGHRAESICFQWWCEDTGTNPSACVQGKSIRHPEHPFMGCTPDFIHTTDAGKKLIQVKCVGAHMAQFWPDEAVPPDVECQVQQEMECADADLADVVAWLGGTDFRIITVERDPEFGAMLIEGARSFWQCVTNDTPPPIDGSESWRKYLSRRYPRVEREELLTATEEVDKYALESLRMRERIAEALKDQEAADNHLRDLCGSGAGFLSVEYKVTWAADKNGKRTLRVKRRKNSNDH